MQTTNPTTSETPWTIRQLEPADHALVYSSWLKSHRMSPQHDAVEPKLFYEGHKRVVEATLQYDGHSYAASDPEDATHVYGWIVGQVIAPRGRVGYDTDFIFAAHYVYVKKPFRGLGVARALVAELRKNADGAPLTFYTHQPPRAFRAAVDRLFPRAKFNPYLMESSS